jgi:hypothetical protein
MAYPHLRLAPAQEVAARIEDALVAGRGFSLIRLGDGEALALAHNLLISASDALCRGPFLRYAGVQLPDLRGRDRLASAVRNADVVGITTSLNYNYFPLLWHALTLHGIDIERLEITSATVNYALHREGHLARLLLDRAERPRVLVVGNLAGSLAVTLSEQGVAVAGAVTPVRGVGDVDRVMLEMATHNYDVALVAAGIPAVIIATEVAHTKNRIVIDFGHLADELVHSIKELRPSGV